MGLGGSSLQSLWFVVGTSETRPLIVPERPWAARSCSAAARPRDDPEVAVRAEAARDRRAGEQVPESPRWRPAEEKGFEFMISRA